MIKVKGPSGTVVEDDTLTANSPAPSIQTTAVADSDSRGFQGQVEVTATKRVIDHHKVARVALALFQRYWFLLGLAIVIGLAWAFPQVGKTDGDIQAQYTVKWGAVIVIFLLSGLGLEVKVMLRTMLRWRLHLVVQVINFIVMPFVMYGIVHFFLAVGARLDASVYQGWLIALSTSTTVSSNAVMTRNANGNDSAGNMPRP